MNKYKAINTAVMLLILLNIIMISALIYLLLQQGNYSDINQSYIYLKSKAFSNYIIWTIICLSILSILLSMLIKKNNISTFIISGMLLLIPLFLLCFITYNQYRYHNIMSGFDPNTVQSSMQSISLDELDQLYDSNLSAIIYVGRPTCPQCYYYEPYINYNVKNSKIKLLHYNTEEDRNDNNENLSIVMSKYGITGVPIIIILYEGKIIDTISEEDMLLQFDKVVSYAAQVE